mgnify:CR=1 FL=1
MPSRERRAPSSRSTGATGTFVEEEAQVEAADLVVMHRVVCCFPIRSGWSAPPRNTRDAYSR